MNNFNNHFEYEEDPEVQLPFPSEVKEEASKSPPPLSTSNQKSAHALTSFIQTLGPKYVMAHHDKARWKIICEKLKPIADEKVSFRDVVQIISFFINNKQFQSNYRKSKKEPIELILETSHLTEKDVYEKKVFPGLAKLILKTEYLFPADKSIPVFTQDNPQKIILSKEQCACLLAHMAFCITCDQGNPKLQHLVDFSGIYENTVGENVILKVQKIKCLFTYFEIFIHENSQENERHVIFERSVLQDVHPEKAWRDCDTQLTHVTIKPKGGIEDSHDALQVVFSDKRLGDQVLQQSATQQPIMNLIHPELMLTILLCEELKEEEAIRVYGAGRYSNYEGYDKEFKFLKASGESDVRERHHVLIDAHEYTSDKKSSQFGEQWILRDLLKAYCGFFGVEDGVVKVATGKWGAGVFKAQVQLKFIIQWIAASRANKNIEFFIFDDEKNFPKEKVDKILEYYEGKKVGDLFSDLLKAAPKLQTQPQSKEEAQIQNKTLFDVLIELFH